MPRNRAERLDDQSLEDGHDSPGAFGSRGQGGGYIAPVAARNSTSDQVRAAASSAVSRMVGRRRSSSSRDAMPTFVHDRDPNPTFGAPAGATVRRAPVAPGPYDGADEPIPAALRAENDPNWTENDEREREELELALAISKSMEDAKLSARVSEHSAATQAGAETEEEVCAPAPARHASHAPLI